VVPSFPRPRAAIDWRCMAVVPALQHLSGAGPTHQERPTLSAEDEEALE
jgi:hypothetical protein